MKSVLKTIFSAIGITFGTFTAAITNVITEAAHGLNDNDMVVLSTDDILPAGLETLTVYYVIQATTDTYKLVNKVTNIPVDVTDTGSGTHTRTMHNVGHAINVEHYKNYELMLDSDGDGDAEMVVKIQASYQKDAPDFSATQADDNSWFYVNIKTLSGSSADVIAGDTGVEFTGADQHTAYNVEANNIVWINGIISGYVEGGITLKVKSGTDN